MMHCGMEVILPDGTLIRTGMGALPDPSSGNSDLPPHEQKANSAWQLFNYGFGPYNDGIFSQSSLGIVVKMGVWVSQPYLSPQWPDLWPRVQVLTVTVKVDAESWGISSLHDHIPSRG